MQLYNKNFSSNYSHMSYSKRNRHVKEKKKYQYRVNFRKDELRLYFSTYRNPKNLASLVYFQHFRLSTTLIKTYLEQNH